MDFPCNLTYPKDDFDRKDGPRNEKAFQDFIVARVHLFAVGVAGWPKQRPRPSWERMEVSEDMDFPCNLTYPKDDFDRKDGPRNEKTRCLNAVCVFVCFNAEIKERIKTTLPF